MIRFVHTADIHFGVENYGKVDQKTGLNSRFLDFVRSFETCVEHAIREKVDLFIFSGDAYKTAYPTPTQQAELLRLFFSLQQQGIPIVIIVGNHDHPLSFGKMHALEICNTVPLEGIYLFSKPESKVIQTKSGPVQVVGIPWPLKNNLVAKNDHRLKDPGQVASYISEKVGLIIQTLADELDPAIPAVLAGHLTVSTGIFSGSEKRAVFGSDPIFLPSQLAINPFDYVALGHLHRHQNLNKNGYPPVVYSGSIERVDFGERKENKGFCLVSLDETKAWGERCSYEFIELPSRPMIQIEVVLERAQNQTKQLLSELAKHTLDGAILKIVYHIPEGESDRVDLRALQRACLTAAYVASIMPVHKQQEREGRADLNVSMDFQSVIEKYLTFKGDIKFNRDALKKKAFALLKSLEDSP